MLSSLARLARCTRLPTQHRLPVHPAQISIQTVRRYNNYPRGPPRYVRFGESESPGGGGGGGRNPWDMRNWDRPTKIMAGIGAFAVVYYVSHLEQVPETGRWRFMDISPKYEALLAETAHQQLLHEFKGKVLPPNHPLTRHIRRVVERILEANGLGTLEAPEIHTRLKSRKDIWSGEPDLPPDVGGSNRQWHLFVVNDDRVVNAMASFGDIVVFTGILPVAKDENGLAAVLGHEIGHAVARHASERYSSAKVFILLATILDVIGIPFSSILAQLLFELPNSRAQEMEADKIGLRLSARACYDPEAVPQMFVRLGQLERATSGRHIDFLATHPASEKRSKALREMLPEAYAAQAASPMCGSTADHMAQFRDTWLGVLDPDRMSEVRW
ncbi:peptidase family M48-domain-containing protein [Trametes polyzona]|nr:peptidase family M48-domain-containing protein [Trametes polyzona]